MKRCSVRSTHAERLRGIGSPPAGPAGKSLAIIKEHINEPRKGYDLEQQPVEQHENIDEDAHAPAQAEMAEQHREERKPLDAAREHRRHVGVERRRVDGRQLARAAPVEADERKAEKIEEADRQPPCAERRQLRRRAPQAPEDAPAEQEEHDGIGEPHDEHDERRELPDHRERRLDLAARLRDRRGIEPHVLIHRERRRKRLREAVELRLPWVDAHEEKEQQEREKLARNGRREPGEECAHAAPAAADAPAEHKPDGRERHAHAQRQKRPRKERQHRGRGHRRRHAKPHALTHYEHEQRQRPEEHGDDAENRQK